MTNRYALGASLGVVLLIGSVMAADKPKSGPQVGDRMGVFLPLHCSGPDEGKKLCLV